jgi:hypothetical protein
MSIHDRCANPNCPKNTSATGALGLDQRWVQVEEHEFLTAGQQPIAGVVRSRLSAVCCTRRCAAEYLLANVAEEDARLAEQEAMLKRWSGATE